MEEYTQSNGDIIKENGELKDGIFIMKVFCAILVLIIIVLTLMTTYYKQTSNFYLHIIQEDTQKSFTELYKYYQDGKESNYTIHGEERKMIEYKDDYGIMYLFPKVEEQ